MSGIYLHIPFCKKACHYCNFHFSTTLNNKAQVLSAMRKEISIVANNEEEISTIYFGGGTPSLLTDVELSTIFNSLHHSFNINPAAEITLEANPDDIDPAKLEVWKAIGINRLSIGIQSFSEADLKWMNRAHSAEQAIESIRLARAAGFRNFSIDLIYGSPDLSDEQWKKNVETVIDLDVPHISSYALTVEKGTALDKMIDKKKSPPVMQEKQAEQFLMLMDWMQENGYEHYEISNFAKPGMRSKHNSSYWSGSKYIGIGPSAHSYDGRSRSWNVANNALYTKQIEAGMLPRETETLSRSQQLNEYIMTAIRTIEGIDLKKIANEFGDVVAGKLLKHAQQYLNSGRCILQNDHIILSREGKLFADGIAAEMFAEDGEV